MRAFHVIGAVFLIASAFPAASRADGMPAASAAPMPGCHCPRPMRAAMHRHYVRHYRHRRVPVLVALPAPFPAYNPPIPSVFDSAYDRVMTQYTRARELDGEYLYEPPYDPRPPILGLPHFRVAAGAVYEYDVMAGGYVQLAQRDAVRAPVAPTP